MSYTEDQLKLLQGHYGSYSFIRPRREKGRQTASDFYAEQEAQLGWSVDQAVSRGLISHESAEEAKVANERTWWDRMFGFEDSSRNLMGSVAQPIIDVLSLGNYAAAATTRATMDDPLVQLGSLKVGFTPSSWLEAFKSRPYYTDMFESAGAGFAFDVALDPLTYLTFGVGAATKVSAGGLAKIGSKQLPEGLKKLTLTRHGEEVYNLAKQRLRPVIEEALEMEGKAAKEAGLPGRRWLRPETLVRIHDQIGKLMVEDYDILARDLVKQKDRWNKFKTSISGNLQQGIKNLKDPGELVPFMGHTAEDLFQETASTLTKEHGVDWGRTGRRLSEMPGVGKVFKAVAPNLHRKLGVPKDIQEVWSLTKNTIDRETSRRVRVIEEGLGDLSSEELNLVTRALEGGDKGISRHFDQDQRKMMDVLVEDGTYLPQNVMDAIAFSKARFKEILDEEVEAGFKTESIQDYVMRIYKTRDARKLILNNINNNQAVPKCSNRGSFTFHRMISTLEEVNEVMGAGKVEKNIGKILSKREAMTVRMIEMEKFYDYIKATSGIAPLMVYQAGNDGRRTASMLKKILKSQQPKDNRIYEFDQLMSMDEALHQKLGFITDEDVYKAGGAGQNVAMLDYLKLEPVDRAGEAGKQIASRIRPNNLAQIRKKFKPEMKLKFIQKSEKKSKNIDITEVLRAEYEGSLPGIDLMSLTGGWFGKSAEDLNMQDIGAVLKSMDRHLRKELDTPLLYLFPDIVERMSKQIARRSTKLGKGASRKSPDRILRKGAQKAMDELEEGLRREVATFGSFVPQLPEEFILRAKMARIKYGDFSDTSRASQWQVGEVDRLKKKLGLRGEHMEEVMHSLLQVRGFDRLSGRGADKLIEFMKLHADEVSSKSGAGHQGHLFNSGVREVVFNQRAKPFFNEATQDVKTSLEHFEELSLQDARRANKYERAGGLIKRIQGRVRDLTKQVDEVKRSMESGTLAPEDIAAAADRIKGLNDEIARKQKQMDSISKIRASNRDPMKLPPLTKDERPYLSTAEVMGRNVAKMSDAEQQLLSRKRGVARETKDVRKLFSSEDLAPAFSARRAVNEKVKELRSEVKRLTEARDNIARGRRPPTKAGDQTIFPFKGDEKAIERLDKSISKVRDNIDSALEEAIQSFAPKVKILSGGRYLDESGTVRDILIREGKKKGFTIMGKDSQKIKQALIAETIRNGRNEVEFLRPALTKEITDTIVGTAASRYYLPEDVARFIEDINTPLYAGRNEMIDGFLKAYDRIQNMFKVPLLAPWFSTMARNGIGNVSINYLKAGLALADPEYLTDYFKILMYTLAKESPSVRKLFVQLQGAKGVAKMEELGRQEIRFLGSDLGKPMTISDLSEELGKRGVFTAWMRDEVFDTDLGAVISQKSGGAAAGAVVGGSTAGPLGALGGAAAGFLFGKETYRMSNLFRFQELASEIPTRLMLGLYAFKQTGSLDEAGSIVRHHLHDYSELSTFERRVMRRLIPFYNFTKMAFRVFGTEVFEHPGRVLLPQKAFHAQNVTGAFFDEPAMPEDVPDWFHRQMVFMGKDIDEETGTAKTWVYGGLNLPLQEVLQLSDIVAPGGRNITEFGSRGTFLGTSVLEYLLNYDTFRGGPIYPNVEAGIKQTPWESGNAFKGSPDWMKTLVGYAIGDDGKPRVNPRMAWLLGEIPTSRFTSLAKKIFDAEDSEAKKFNIPALAQSLVGVAQYKYDPETQQYFRNKKKVDAMTSVLANIRVLKSYSIDRSTFESPKEKKSSHPLAGGGPLASLQNIR